MEDKDKAELLIKYLQELTRLNDSYKNETSKRILSTMNEIEKLLIK